MWHDIRFALRAARRSPGFTLVAIASLTLGIGSTTAIFSLLYQVVFRPLPVKNPASLVLLQSDTASLGTARRDNDWSIYSYPLFRALRDGNTVLAGLTARSSFPVTLGYNGESVRATAEVVAGDYFGVLGLTPQTGRLLTLDDEVNRTPAVVLSYAYWSDRLGRDPGVLNRRILLNGQPMTVAGVAPRSFRGLLAGQTPDIFASVSLMDTVSPGWKIDPVDVSWLNIIGRLKPGVPAPQAAAALLPSFRAILADHTGQVAELSPETRQRVLQKPLRVESAARGLNRLQSEWQSPLLVLLMMVSLLLLIACANIAGLLLVRAVARQRELALRLALGASRWQVARQYLVESLGLALAGGLLGLLICESLTAGLLRLLPPDFTGGWLVAETDWRLLAFSLALAVATSFVFGLAPIVRAAVPDPAALLRQSAGLSASVQSSRIRQAFVAAQICLSLLLLAGAGLFTRTLLNLVAADPGFQPDRLLTFSLDPSLSGYTPDRALNLFLDLDQRFAALPHVRTVTRASLQPFGGWSWGNSVKVPDSPRHANQQYGCGENAVTPGYFHAIGTALTAGREFTAADSRNAPKVAIVNQAFARLLFENENPVGRHITARKTDVEIVGVVKDSKFQDLRETPQPFLYVPHEQAGADMERHAAYFLRTASDDAALASAIRAIVKQADPSLPVQDIATMRTILDQSIYQDRLIASLSIAFGVLAALLAALGLYGTMSYSAACRTNEFGIRLALGANPRTVLAMVIREAVQLIAIGVAGGLGLCLVLTHFAQSQFYGVGAHDPGSLLGAALLTAVLGTVAALAPAVRSMRISPLSALRYQ